MLVVLIVVPAIVVAVAVVAVLDWLGVLPRLDTGTTGAPGSFFEHLPRAALYAAAGVMAAWIVAWIVFFVIGISTLSG
jgi:hypothetical protein